MKIPKIVQIACTSDELFALDENGYVWKCEWNDSIDEYQWYLRPRLPKVNVEDE